MTRYGRSPWLERVPRTRVPAYPRLRKAITTDVAIVGGGLTGCAIAYAFAAAGIKVVLIEADRLGQASSAAGFGWLSDMPASTFHDLEKTVGVRRARSAWQAWRRAALDCAALLRRLDVKCLLTPRDSLQLARTPEQVAALKRDLKSRKAAGLDAALLDAKATTAASGIDALAGLRTRDGASLDPYRATLGLAAAAVARGAQLFEKSAVKKIVANARSVDIQTADATVTAYRVIVATGQPTALFTSLARHVKPLATYFALTAVIPSRLRKTLGARNSVTASVVMDGADPARYVRWVDDERLLVSGADGPLVPERLREKTLVQRTGQLMYELSTLYPDVSGTAASHGWSASYVRTADGLPFIGPHRNFPRHLFAFGGNAHSVTEAYLASRILLRHYLSETDAVDEVFAFTRSQATR